VCFGTVGCSAWAHPARLDFLPSAGTSLLDYERGVPVARPHGGREDNGFLWHIKETNLTDRPMHESQYGFRKGKSTDQALSKAVNIIEKD
jgi:hypothetical protein